MLVINKIAVGIDFSDQSEAALRAAIALARRVGAEVEMIHVTLMFELDDSSSNYSEIFRDHQKRLRARIGELRERYLGQGVELSQGLADGRPTSELARLAADVGAELLVVGTRGYTGLKRFFLGSVAEAVVRHSKIDVLVVRGDGDLRLDRILVPTDFSPSADRALAVAEDLAAPGGAIDLLHCWRVPEPIDAYAIGSATVADLKDTLATSARTLGARRVAACPRRDLAVQFVAVEAPVRAEIAGRADGADLVVIGTHGRRGVRRLLLGSVALATVRHAPCSVLVTQPPRPDQRA